MREREQTLPFCFSSLFIYIISYLLPKRYRGFNTITAGYWENFWSNSNLFWVYTTSKKKFQDFNNLKEEEEEEEKAVSQCPWLFIRLWTSALLWRVILYTSLVVVSDFLLRLHWSPSLSSCYTLTCTIRHIFIFVHSLSLFNGSTPHLFSPSKREVRLFSCCVYCLV